MTKFSFVIFHKDVPWFLKELQELGVMDITRSARPASEDSKNLFAQISRNKAAVKSLEKILKENKDRKPSRTAALSAEQAVSQTEELILKTSSLKAEISALKSELEQAAPWGEFGKEDISKIRALGLELYFVSIPIKKFSENLKEQYALEEISRTADNVYAVILAPESQAPKGKFKILEEPKRAASEVTLSIRATEESLKEATDVLLSITSLIPDINASTDALSAKADLMLAGESSEKAAESTIEVFTGFAPSETKNEICTKLNSLEGGMYYTAEDATIEDNPPISLKNNWFTRMFAVLTDLYGRPAYNEFDPTPYLSVFFMLFFAMCMGDAGYGLALILVGIFMRRTSGTARFAPLVLTLGIATTVVGFVLHTFFGIDLIQASWIPDGAKKFMITGKIAGYDTQMLLSLAIGVLHICVAMVVKAVYAVKKNGWATSIGTIGWTLLIVGGVVILALTLLANLSSSLTKTIVIALGVVSALSIFFFSNLKKNPLANFGNGLWETYNTVTGLLGDVLSYIRLYALGLAGGMLGAAFNQLAGMIVEGQSGFSAGWIFFVLIVVLGHVLNLAMCCLGAFVHPLRLNFLEFFKNSGYEGSGKKYKPLTINNN